VKDPLESTKAREAAARLLMNKNDGSSDLAVGERQVLAREQALKASAAGGVTRTTYSYATGPDGKRYIVGAEVSIVGSKDVLDAVPGGTPTSGNAGVKLSSEPEKVGLAKNSESGEEDEATRSAVAELEQIESEVIAHEAAHQAAAGRFGGPASYTYTTGPDGKKYITGGEVPISTPSTNNPEEALRNASQVMRAAMAPGDPSGQDVAVAASAAQMAAAARAQMSSGKTGDGGEQDGSGKKAGIAPAAANSAKKAAKAYSSQVSPRGLWTASGYNERPVAAELKPWQDEHNHKITPEPYRDFGDFDIAA
jgi:hypothetical protein